MTDTVEKPSHDNGGTAAQAPLPYESVWMAHWMHKNCPSSSPSSSSGAGKFFVSAEVSEENDKGKQPALVSVSSLEEDTFGNAGESKEIVESAKPAVLEDNLKRNSNKLRKGRVDSFPTFSGTQKRVHFLSRKGHAMRTDFAEDFESGRSRFPFDVTASSLPSIHPGTGTSSGEHYFQPAGLASHLNLSLKPHNSTERSSLATPSSYWNNGMKSRLDFVPHGCNSTMNSMLQGNHGNLFTNSNVESKEIIGNSNYFSSSDIHDQTPQGFWERRSTGISILGLKGAAADCVPDQHQNMKSLISHQSFHTEGTETKRFYDRSPSVPHMPSTLHDVENMRIYTTIDSVEGSSRDHPKLSQTTHRLWITKETNVNLSESGQFARESKISSKFMSGAFKHLFNLSPDISLYGQQGQGVKLLSFGGSVDSDKENLRDVKNSTTLKNESSAETNIMDVNVLLENHLSGIHSLSSKKPKDDPKLPTFLAASTSGAKRNRGRPLTLVPDINLALPKLPASPVDDRDSTSRTHTLDMEYLLSNSEQRMDSRSISYSTSSLVPEPSSRWIKRLKSASDSAYGTKTLNLEDRSQEQAHKIFNTTMKASKSISDTKFSRYHGEEQMVPDVTATSFVNGEPSSSNPTRKSQDIKLSHPWIQRWSHVQTAYWQKKIKPVVVCDPEESNAVLEELPKKQFPSVAALALMGKALNGFRPCKFTKRGSIMVWNTNGD